MDLTAQVDLTARWLGVLARLGGRPTEAACRGLLTRYGEPQRHYHNIIHLSTMLSTVDILASYAAAPDLVRLATWYHDAVYDPRRADNEERSARLAEADLLLAGLDIMMINAVARLVRLTAGHNPQPGDRDAAVLCDADLRVLGSPNPDYDEYVAAVRREYDHVDVVGWRAGRGTVLRGLLGRPALFRTPAGRVWEQSARDNLNRELTGLDDLSDGAVLPR